MERLQTTLGRKQIELVKLQYFFSLVVLLVKQCIELESYYI